MFIAESNHLKLVTPRCEETYSLHQKQSRDNHYLQAGQWGILAYRSSNKHQKRPDLVIRWVISTHTCKTPACLKLVFLQVIRGQTSWAGSWWIPVAGLQVSGHHKIAAYRRHCAISQMAVVCLRLRGRHEEGGLRLRQTLADTFRWETPGDRFRNRDERRRWQ